MGTAAGGGSGRREGVFVAGRREGRRVELQVFLEVGVAEIALGNASVLGVCDSDRWYFGSLEGGFRGDGGGRKEELGAYFLIVDIDDDVVAVLLAGHCVGE